MSVTVCNGIPYMIAVVTGNPYVIIANVHVEGGLVNGEISSIRQIVFPHEKELYNVNVEPGVISFDCSAYVAVMTRLIQ